MKEKVAITGTGFLSETDCCLINFPGEAKEKKELEKNHTLNELLTDSIVKKYRGISDYVKYGYLAAVKSLEDVRIFNKDQCGVYSGTAYGGIVEVYTKQCQTYYEKGISWMLPSMVMNKVAKTTADIITIEEKITGGSFNIHAGRCSSGLALLQAYDHIRINQKESALVLGAEHIDSKLSEVYLKMNYPTDRLCSGGCALILNGETQADFDKIKGYISACECTSFYIDPDQPDTKVFSEVTSKVIQQALNKSNLRISDIDLIVYAKTYNQQIDVCFNHCINYILQNTASNRLYCATDRYGDMIGANPLLVVLTALSFINHKNKKNPNRIMAVTYGTTGQVWIAIIENK